jgi:hypothetical protein
MQRPSRQLNFEAVRKWAESLSAEDRARWLDSRLEPDWERAKEPTVEQPAAPEQTPAQWPNSPLEPDGERAIEQQAAPEQAPAQWPNSPLEPAWEGAKEPEVKQQEALEQERQPLLPAGSIILLTVVLLIGAVFISWLW